MSVRMAASTFNIPKSTLQDRISKMGKNGQNEVNNSDSGNESESDVTLNISVHATRQVFSPREEAELDMKKSSKMFYGLTYRAVRSLAYEYAGKLGKVYPKTWDENELAGME